MKKFYQYIIQVNSTNFKTYAFIIIPMVIINHFTSFFNKFGIYNNALIYFFLFSLFLKIIPHLSFKKPPAYAVFIILAASLGFGQKLPTDQLLITILYFLILVTIYHERT